MIDIIKNSNKGAIALLLVIMITALTIVSVVAVSMSNISNLISSYHLSEVEEATVNMDDCIEDALFRLSSSTDASGDYYLNGAGTNCQYQISDVVVSGLKTVTSTASTTSSLGYWEDVVVAQINVSSTPVSIYSYKNFNMSYSPIDVVVCGDATCSGSENASTCPADCSVSCGDTYCTHTENASTCPADCPASCGDTYCTHTEDCSSCSADCGSCGAVCGNGILESGETCDYTGGCADSCCLGQLGCATGKRGYSACQQDCTRCLVGCLILEL